MSSYMRNLERHAASVAARRITTGDARTQDLYVQGGKDKPLEQLPDVQLRRGMCPRAMGSTMVCRMSCQSPCSFGRILMAREDERKASKASGSQATSAEVNSTVSPDRRIKEPKAPGAEVNSTADQAGRKNEPKAPKSPKPAGMETGNSPEAVQRRKEHARKASLAAAEARRRKAAEEANKPRTPRETEEEYKRQKKNEYMRTYYQENKERMTRYNRDYKRMETQRRNEQQERERAAEREAMAARTDLPVRETVAARIVLSMYNNGMTSAEVAKELNVQEATARSWVTGSRMPTLDRLGDVCKLLNVSADWLLGLEVSHGH